jgi:hypothetical protein
VEFGGSGGLEGEKKPGLSWLFRRGQSQSGLGCGTDSGRKPADQKERDRDVGHKDNEGLAYNQDGGSDKHHHAGGEG